MLRCKVCGGTLVLDYDLRRHREVIKCINCSREYGNPPLLIAEKKRPQPAMILKERRV